MKIKTGGILVFNQKRQPQHLYARLAGWVAIFSSECEICRKLQAQITQLNISLQKQSSMARYSLSDYLDVMKNITRHMKNAHGLVEEKHYIKLCVCTSFTIGMAMILLGLVLLNFGITLLTWNIILVALIIRVIFSYIIGCFLDKRTLKLGKTL